MKASIVTGVVLVFFQYISLAQDTSYLSEYSSAFGRSMSIGMINDANPAINQESNDFGHTVGMLLDYSFSRPEKNRYYEFSLESNLYTENVDDSHYYNESNRKIYPQYFTEISSLNISIDKYFTDKQYFIGVKTYVGIYNRKKPIPGLTLYCQGGMDGEGGYHKIMGNNPGLENIATGPQQFLFYIEPSIKKYFFKHILTKNDYAYLQVHSGVKIGTPFKGVKAFVNASAELPLVQFSSHRTNLFKLSLLYKHELSLHKDGLLYMPEIGAEASFLFLSIGYTSNFYVGNRNVSMENYYDDERLMYVYLKVKLFDMLF